MAIPSKKWRKRNLVSMDLGAESLRLLDGCVDRLAVVPMKPWAFAANRSSAVRLAVALFARWLDLGMDPFDFSRLKKEKERSP